MNDFEGKRVSNYDLKDRLIKFAVGILNVSESMNRTYAGVYFAKQLIRSGCSPALIYGEAMAAESRKDFIHKMKLALKELRETEINLIIISEKQLSGRSDLNSEIDECDQLIAIFVKSIQTAKKNLNS